MLYIGKTCMSLNARKYYHLYDAKRGSRVYFHNALRKYGVGNFDWQVIDQAESKQELNEKEKYWIQFYKSFDPQFGYNLTMGGDGNTAGNKLSGETKRKIGAALEGHITSIETRQKISVANKGRIYPEEYGKKMSTILRGRKQPNEVVQKRAKSLKGHITSDETRRKIGIANKGKIRTEEQKEQQRRKMKGRKLPEYAGQHVGRTQSKEIKDKISIKMKQVWQERRSGGTEWTGKV